ncbi:hypothetical protein MCHLDSM_00537 [Mycolicibacterium chlorophenolicum]|uniref:Uncharacterized protein n=1 Tax=Mycolicibacterium chlorophenolicum TaxID=37916 RepID=A0A0J6ZEW7_9MYCO|nr:hypothetical protein MCHLDSM_00537 [Mycolicibacterium chlorophenolicum]MDZ4236162.1 hypothetical protein [Dietzia sp.]
MQCHGGQPGLLFDADKDDPEFGYRSPFIRESMLYLTILLENTRALAR